ncbi:hypothetical protein ACPW96_01165 [Micromonospora sp. DT81.3]|uniref:hypothetical protein n=1 Tax=Actinomycetes TaxID=1760 RepID=UPI003CFA81AE
MDLTSPTMIEIAIQDISIEGFGFVDGEILQHSLPRDLARLVADRGLPASWTSGTPLGDLTATLDWDGRGGTEALSQALAAQLYEGMAS